MPGSNFVVVVVVEVVKVVVETVVVVLVVVVVCVTVVGRATVPLEPQLHQNMREKEQCEGEQQMY